MNKEEEREFFRKLYKEIREKEVSKPSPILERFPETHEEYHRIVVLAKLRYLLRIVRGRKEVLKDG